MNNKRVILIGIDGAGSAIGSTYTPNINEIIKDYAFTRYGMSESPTISAQCWGSMLLGVAPEVHGFNNGSITYNPNKISDKYPSIFKVIRNNDVNCKLVSFCNWNPINIGIIEDDIEVYKDTNPNDKELSDMICNYIESNNFTMMFIHFDSVDYAGHSMGYFTEGYYEALNKVDMYVNDIFNSLKKQNMIDDTLIIIATDHGGIEYSHGGETKEEKEVFIGFRANNINKLEITNIRLRDYPAIICKYLDIEIPTAFDSKIPDKLFK